jgi:hypothetical protein
VWAFATDKSATAGREGTIHHLIALFCTVAGKHSSTTYYVSSLFNEIKGLEPTPQVRDGKNRSK